MVTLFPSPYAFSWVKRAVDIAIGGVGLVLTGGLLPWVALAIWLNSPGPVFYRQVRVGLGGAPFMLVKLRTMRADAEAGGEAVWAHEGDPRVTGVGRILRRLYIDELPQCWNILRGEMSVIGPRPERPELVALIEREVPEFCGRTMVRPGITGWAQVNYKYGNSVEDARVKLGYDEEYIRSCSLGLDLRIMLRTALHVLGMKGM